MLDPEQNQHFNDHYLEVDFDLSQVMFITTANMLHTIPPALHDRMEIIRLPGYLEPEKAQIATRFLLPQQAEAHGLAKDEVNFTPNTVQAIVSQYTREAGVRNLEREIATVMRKVAREIASKPAEKVRKPVRVRAASLTRYLGVPKFTKRRLEQHNWVGVAAGLAWTDGGGDLLTIEVTTIPGRGKLMLTGKLGDVMRESAQAALSYARSRAELLRLDRDFYQDIDIHIHVPEGAIPKDGPSAGITMAVALVSALTGLTVRRDVAMTGEITLRGNVLPIGGLTEKVVAAHQAGYAVVLLPEENRKDASEIPSEVRRGLAIRFVESMDQVLDFALVGERRGEMPFFNAARPEILPEPVIAPLPEVPAVLEPAPPTSTTTDKPATTPSGPAEGEPGYAH